ncbi:hypothetical protein GCM10007977_066540 [Dactylosporangium sucinum]|uniref:Uncharacterized protein n=1 Tax=Dactylosporangium sucinum TaxID=1424081 RepID=A0A917X2A2_9ACTN|nr:hypothetical protein GCM10007977_066540 [Dactylosporangium sucinum]
MIDVEKIARRIMTEDGAGDDDRGEIARIATQARLGRLGETFTPQEHIAPARTDTGPASAADRAEAREAVLMLLGHAPTRGRSSGTDNDPTGMRRYRVMRQAQDRADGRL